MNYYATRRDAPNLFQSVQFDHAAWFPLRGCEQRPRELSETSYVLNAVKVKKKIMPSTIVWNMGERYDIMMRNGGIYGDGVEVLCSSQLLSFLKFLLI